MANLNSKFVCIKKLSSNDNDIGLQHYQKQSSFHRPLRQNATVSFFFPTHFPKIQVQKDASQNAPLFTTKTFIFPPITLKWLKKVIYGFERSKSSWPSVRAEQQIWQKHQKLYLISVQVQQRCIRIQVDHSDVWTLFLRLILHHHILISKCAAKLISLLAHLKVLLFKSCFTNEETNTKLKSSQPW